MFDEADSTGSSASVTTGQFMVLAEHGGVTTSPLRTANREEAWTLAKELRAAGHRVWIYRSHATGLDLLVDDEQPLE